ncbi:unnamed protein product [Thelazia callipaeda]|uniref:KH_dom_type_1 domain-containing protein n=1 Tax=Thelazia callipaeda TaxID=103827 RepID=A0A0N5D8S8_THECL|nr:unnamed protein product [Thelazia callipaeda]
MVQGSPELMPVYEFEIPNTLVGLIIGIKGKTIKVLMETHQICAVEGARENINRCLRMVRRRFPVARFPELNLRPVLPPPFPDPPPAFFALKPIQVFFFYFPNLFNFLVVLSNLSLHRSFHL